MDPEPEDTRQEEGESVSQGVAPESEEDPSAFDVLLRDAVRVPERRVLVPGSLVGGRYRIERRLGQGGMGAVYAARHDITGRQVALKFLSGASTEDETVLRRFQREARAASAVDHPAVVRVLDFFEDSGDPVMVMELLDGQTLRDELIRHGPLSAGLTAHLLLPIVGAVHKAHHQGIVHRDLKPENILLTPGEPSARVLDFGLAWFREFAGSTVETRLTRTGARLGTAAYMAPEQAFGQRDIDARADIWSLGAVLYECVSGRRFVRADKLPDVIRELSAGAPLPSTLLDASAGGFGEILDRMLVRDRDARLESLAVVEERLAALASEHLHSRPRRAPARSSLPSPDFSAATPGRRKRGWGPRIAGAALLAAVATVVASRGPAPAPLPSRVATPEEPRNVVLAPRPSARREPASDPIGPPRAVATPKGLDARVASPRKQPPLRATARSGTPVTEAPPPPGSTSAWGLIEQVPF
jgi:eukaryotic-like serine/threonine-protein kinase